MDTARCYRQSDPEKNWNFSRPWGERSVPRPAPTPAPTAADAEPGMATLLRWREEWRARRAALPSRQGTAL
jgi:hypothetical protein